MPTALVLTDDDGGGSRLVPAAPTTTGGPTTTVAATAAAVATAILGNGDAVTVAADLTTSLRFAGADPRDAPPEGELTVVDSVVLTPDGRTFVSTCCEPVPGTWFEVDATGQPISDVRYGHALALSPDGTRLASVGAGGITVTDLDGAILASADRSTGPVHRQPESVMWVDDATLAIVELRQPDTGNELRLDVIDAGLTAAAAAEGVVIGTDIEATWPHLGGIAADGSVLVFRGARGGTIADRLEAYDAVTLAPRPASDVVLPGPAVDAWSAGGRLTWVGIDDVLHLDGTEVSGEFAWARPAG